MAGKVQLLKGINTWPDLSWSLAFKVFLRNLRVFKKTWKANLMFNFIEPVLYLTAMGFGLGVYVSKVHGLPYLDFLAPGLICSSAMFSTSYEMTYDSFTRMNHQKVFQAIVATPASVDDIVMGEILFGTFKGVLYGTVFMFVTLFFGVVKSPLALFVPFFLALLALNLSILSMVWTSIAPNYDSFGYFFTLFISPMFLFSGVFFPVETLPEGVRFLSWFTPLYHTAEVVRPLVLGRVGTGILSHIAWLAAFILLFIRFPLAMVKNRLIK